MMKALSRTEFDSENERYRMLDHLRRATGQQWPQACPENQWE
jgi:hypothetical protein